MLDEFTSSGAVFYDCCGMLDGYLRGTGRSAVYIFFSFFGFGSFGFTGRLAFTRGVRRDRQLVGPAVAEIWTTCRKVGSRERMVLLVITESYTHWEEGVIKRIGMGGKVLVIWEE